MAPVCVCMYRGLIDLLFHLINYGTNQLLCVCGSTASLRVLIASGSAAGRFSSINKDVYRSCCGMSMPGERKNNEINNTHTPYIYIYGFGKLSTQEVLRGLRFFQAVWVCNESGELVSL